MLKPGTAAPNFTLPDQIGESFELKRALQSGPLVLYFYPKDHTPGCTVEACRFRDQHAEFERLGARVYGISSDDAAAHESFRDKHDLPFDLLTDAGGQVANLYGVKKTLGLLPGRATFVIDREGVVRSAFSSQFNPKAHVDKAREVLSSLG